MLGKNPKPIKRKTMSKMSELSIEFQNQYRELIETGDLEELEKERQKFMRKKAYEADEKRLRKKLTKEHGKIYTTVELQEKFTVKYFASPYVFVTRKSDSLGGTLEFTHMPRFYFDFQTIS